MSALLVLILGGAVLWVAGQYYSRFLARRIGEVPERATPAVVKADGRDYVATPTPVVFAHHFASIAGAGPIVGPVIAIIYGWLPAVLWVLVGGVFIGAAHDYLATYMATREGGQSIATIVRRLLGKDAFIAMALFLVVMLALVCATFLNLSASALTSMLPFDRLQLPEGQHLLRTNAAGDKVVIGGIASMSVIVITAVAPLLGYLYLKRKVAVWKCSILAILISGISIVFGLFYPVAFPESTILLGMPVTGQQIWVMLLSLYVLVAAGVPVWIFLQSRDFINVHILYVGMAAVVVTLLVAAVRGGGNGEMIPAVNIGEGTQALGHVWPGLFIVIACGAVSGFHSLCAGGTTCKQLNSEVAARRIGYFGMILESFWAVCVIALLMIGASKAHYIADVHPGLLGAGGKSNPVLGFAMAVGNAGYLAFGVPIAVGAVAGMVLLEGFLVTTLDTGIRLTRYLIEEVWAALFDRYDMFAIDTRLASPDETTTGPVTPMGADGLPATIEHADKRVPATEIIPTHGLLRGFFRLIRFYWFNSAIAVAITLALALTGGVKVLWGIFATSNQLLAAMVLGLAALWLVRQGRRYWFALIPGIFMLITTAYNLVLLGRKFANPATKNTSLLSADIIISIITVYLIIAGVRTVWRQFGHKHATQNTQ